MLSAQKINLYNISFFKFLLALYIKMNGTKNLPMSSVEFHKRMVVGNFDMWRTHCCQQKWTNIVQLKTRLVVQINGKKNHEKKPFFKSSFMCIMFLWSGNWKNTHQWLVLENVQTCFSTTVLIGNVQCTIVYCHIWKICNFTPIFWKCVLFNVQCVSS